MKKADLIKMRQENVSNGIRHWFRWWSRMRS